MNNGRNPLVSVLMTAYNRKKYIAQAIESVLNSTYVNFELIIVDDGSKDDTVVVAKEYAKKDNRVKVYQNEKNLGDYPNRNMAASYARGKYIKYLDSDDIIYPHGLQVMVDCMEKYPDAGFGLIQNGFVTQPHPILFEPRDAYYHNFLIGDLFGRAPGSAIINRQAFIDTGGFSGLRQMGDYEYWLKLGKIVPLVTIPRDLVWDRVHGEQEKFYDSTIDKEAMWVNVAIAALQNSTCPLTEKEIKKSISTLYAGLRKTFWRLVLQNFHIKSALEYKNKLNLSWATIFALEHKEKSL